MAAETVSVASELSLPIGGGEISVQEVAAEIVGRAPAVVIFFTTTCPRSRRVFPKFAELADVVSEDTSVLAYSAREADGPDLPEFLAASGASFRASVMQRWLPGEFSRSMQEIGLHVGDPWFMPMVAVVGEGGAILGEWQGVSDMVAVKRALASGGMLR